jgi:hypothetical protein
MEHTIESKKAQTMSSNIKLIRARKKTVYSNHSLFAVPMDISSTAMARFPQTRMMQQY